MLMLSGNILKKTYPFKDEKNLHLGYFANLAAMALADQLGKDDKDVKMSQVQLVIGNTEYGGHRYGDGLQQKSFRSDFNTLFYEIPEVQQQIATHRAVTILVVHKEVVDLCTHLDTSAD